jgi:hypothetical protein
MQKFAQRMRAQKQMQAATEPYVAYGATEDLFRACARAGEYTMPTVAEGEEPLRSAKGEDIGVGQGWWYQGNILFHCPVLDPPRLTRIDRAGSNSDFHDMGSDHLRTHVSPNGTSEDVP